MFIDYRTFLAYTKLSPIKRIFSLWCVLIISQLIHAQEMPKMADQDKPEEVEIAEIKVDGIKYLDKSILVSLSGLHVGQKITLPSEEIAKAIKTLWKQRLFSRIEITQDKLENGKIYLTYILEEKPRISRYTIRGIKNGEIEEVRKKIELRSGQIFTDQLRAETIRHINKYCFDKGYLYPTVTIEEKPDTLLPNSKLIMIKIDKGLKYKIDHIYFSGNDAVSAVQLKKALKETHERVKVDLKGFFSFRKNRDTSNHSTFYEKLGELAPSRFLDYTANYINLNIFKSSHFNRIKFEDDKKKLIELYNSKGYRDAQLISDTVYSAGDKKINIGIALSEGKQYYFRNIYWKGNTKYPDSTLSKILAIHKGDIYNQKALDEKLYMSQNSDDVTSLYMDDGYLFFNVNPTEVMVDGDSIDLEMRIYEGAQATINKVNISGNDKTNEKVIRRELRIVPGDKFDRSKLIRTQRELAALNYFDPQQMQINPRPNPENGTVDIDIAVVEKPSDQLELSAGYGGTGRGIFGTLGLQFTNFSVKNIFDKKAWTPLPSGDGQNLAIRVQSNGRQQQTYSVSFTEPWLGGKKPNALTVGFRSTKFNQFENYYVANSPIIGSFQTIGGSIEYGKRLKKPDDYFVFNGAIELDHYKLNNFGSFGFGYATGRTTNLAGQLRLSRNSTTGPVGPLFPTTGSNMEFSLKATLPYYLMGLQNKNIDFSNPDIPAEDRYKLIEYYKFKYKFEWYTPIVGNFVFKASAKGGFMGAYSKKVGLSSFETFQVGGDGLSVQNYSGREIISQRGYPNDYTSSSGAPIYNKYAMELRLPLSLNPSASIYTVAFAEGANAWYSAKDYNPFDLKRSVGAGVRVFLPMFGLLGFDYGLGIDRNTLSGFQEDKTKGFFGNYGHFRLILGFEPE